MRLNKKLTKWLDARLIDERTVQSILAFEKSTSRPVALWAAGGLGAFAIIIGMVSVIAANWLQTPPELKLAIDLVLCAALAFAVYKVCKNTEVTQEKLWLREILVILYFGFTLASMALIGQTYQLGGSVAKLLLVWTIATLPLVLLARGKFIAVLWVVGTAITYGLNVDALYKYTTHTLDFDRHDMEILAISLYLIGPLLFIHLSRLPWLLQHRPVFAREVSRYSWLVILMAGFFAQFLWYGRNLNYVPFAVFIFSGFATAATAYLVPVIYKDSSTDTHRVMRVILAVVFLLGFSACWHQSSLDVIGAFTNLAYLCVLAWATLKIGSTPLFNLMTAIISIRILFIYFEVFGSMLQTGLGLISGGLLTLLLAWLWFRKSNNLAEHLGTGSGQIHGDSHEG
jgi:uncharacterized membrane protein